MPGNDIKGAAEQILKRPLEPIEQLILENSWEGRTYSEIAKISGYASVYVREVGSRLWKALSDSLGARVTKKNLQLLLNADQVAQANAPEFPSGPLAANSPLYIERPPIEQRATKTLRQPGCLLRIQSSRKMGRTSLLYRLMGEAKKFGYSSAVLNFRQVEPEVFEDLDTFLQWFCAAVSYQLDGGAEVESFWQEGIGSKLNCTLYFERQLLEPSKNPIVLAIQEVDFLFQYPDLVKEFFLILRGWHEEAQRLESWQKLRIILAYATDAYMPLQLSHSLLNVGLTLRLREFVPSQVRQLAQRYGVKNFDDERCNQLMRLLGGHPYLTAIALYHLATASMTLEELLKSAVKTNGIYGNHLRGHWFMIQGHPELAQPLYEVVNGTGGVAIDSVAAYQLEAAGLINLEERLAYPACNLYRQFFVHQLRHVRLPDVKSSKFPGAPQADSPALERKNDGTVAVETEMQPGQRGLQSLEKRVEFLEQQVRELKQLNQLDRITQVMNRAAFEVRLKELWRTASANSQPISLLLCGIDFFNVYVESYGQIQGEACLQQVARTITACLDRTSENVGMHGSDRFLILIPYGSAQQALAIADQIRQRVENLEIRHPSNYMGWPAQVVTVSIGVASTTATAEQTEAQLLEMAENGFRQAERQGHNCVKLLNF